MSKSDFTVNVTPDQPRRIDEVNESQEAEQSITETQVNTGAEEVSKTQSKSLINNNYKTGRMAKVLQETYCFSNEAASQISAFAEKIWGKDINIQPGVLTKIKSLCAKILRFFGYENNARLMQKEGLEMFNRLKNELLAPEKIGETLSLFNQCKNEEIIIKGFSRILGLYESEAQPEHLEAFINVNYFNKLTTYSGENGKNAFLKNVLDRCLDPLLTLEERKKKLDAFIGIADQYLTKPKDSDNNKLEEKFCYQTILNSYAVKIKTAIDDAVKGKQGVIEELTNLQKRFDVHFRLFQAIPNGKTLTSLRLCKGMNDTRIYDINVLEDIVKYAQEKPLYNLLLNPQLLKISPDAKTFLEQKVLPLTKEEVQAGLAKELCKPSKSMTTVFSSKNQIFKDLERSFKLTLHVGNKEIPVDVPEFSVNGENAFQILNNTIASLLPEEQERVQEFCKNFPTQGILAINHPRLQQQARIEGKTTHLDVRFSKGSIHVCVTAGGKDGVNALYGNLDAFITTNITTPVCKFEFDYHPENGSSSNVNMIEYSGQNVSIDLDAKGSG